LHHYVYLPEQLVFSACLYPVRSLVPSQEPSKKSVVTLFVALIVATSVASFSNSSYNSFHLCMRCTLPASRNSVPQRYVPLLACRLCNTYHGDDCVLSGSTHALPTLSADTTSLQKSHWTTYFLCADFVHSAAQPHLKDSGIILFACLQIVDSHSAALSYCFHWFLLIPVFGLSIDSASCRST